MSGFKKGQKVRCVKAEGYTFLTVGEIYTVEASTAKFTEVEEGVFAMYTNRFEPECKRHVHADMIIAWANGATIEWFDGQQELWKVCTRTPHWSGGTLCRIKPELTEVQLQVIELKKQMAKMQLTINDLEDEVNE